MKIPTFFSPDVSSSTIVLSDKEAHHAFGVLRVRSGDMCYVVDAQGHKIQGRVETDNQIEVFKRLRVARPFGEISWLVPLLELDDLKQIIQAATVLGIVQVHLVQTQFNQVSKRDPDKTMEKLQRVVLAAQKLASLPYQPELHLSFLRVPLDSVFEGHKGSLLVFHQNAPQLLRSSSKEMSSPLKFPLLCFGPEGGFSDTEIEQFKNHKAHIISLGDVNYPSTLAPIVATTQVCNHA